MRNLILISSLLTVLTSCDGLNTGPETKPVNPNGDPSTGSGQASELALLMREMFDDALLIKQRVIRGERPDGLKRFEDIHRAVPTDKEVKGPVFEAFSEAYIQSIKQLEASAYYDPIHFHIRP